MFVGDPGVEYRGIERLDGYMFGSDGSVWTCLKRKYVKLENGCFAGAIHGKDESSWRKRKATYKPKRKCMQIKLYGKFYKVHHLILEAFGFRREPKQDCRHLNGNAQDNRIENLVYGTRKENVRDAIIHGTAWGYGKPMSTWKPETIKRHIEAN
jgi:hypothetical protein